MNIREESIKVLDEVINNPSHNIDDSAYILAQISEKDKSANTKKVIKKFALQLSEKTKNKETLKKLHQLTKWWFIKRKSLILIILKLGTFILLARLIHF